MLSIQINDEWKPIITQDNYFIEQTEEGEQSLSFDLSKNDEFFSSIRTEMLVRNDENEWIVKGINLPSNTATITCSLNMKDWNTGHYLNTKDIPELQTKTVGDVLNYIKPTGWTILNATVRTIKRTPDKEKCTRYDILQRCKEIYDVQFDIDCLNKSIKVIDPYVLIDNGVYVTPQLNMRGISYKESSNNRVTRLYCYGADNLTFESINNGKSYVENTTYTTDILTGTWTDGRYTNKETLLEDGKKKVDELAIPTGSYTIDMVDMSNDEMYKFLKLSLREVAHCIINDKLSINHRVVKIRNYPNTPSKKVITLSNEPRKIQDMMSQIQESVEDTTNTSYKHETIMRNNSESIELIAKGLGEVQLKLTDEQIMMIISSAINGGNALETMQAIFDVSGLTIKNGGIKVYDGRGNLVFYIDQNTKKLVFTGDLYGANIVGGTIKGNTTIDVGTYLKVGNGIILDESADDYSSRSITLGRTFMSYTGKKTSETSNFILSTNTNGGYSNLTANGGLNPSSGLSTYKGDQGTSIILYPDGFLVYGNSAFYGDIIATKNLTVLGTKNRLVKDYIQGNILMNAVESTEPVFEDYGTCELDSNGKCVIRLEKRFLATANAKELYYVFLTKLSEGDLFVKNKYNFAFVVQGTPNLKFDWRITAKQRGYENVRMDEFIKGDK